MSDLTPERLDEIEKAAKEAVASDQIGGWVSSAPDLDLLTRDEIDYVGAMDPATTLALIAEVKGARRLVRMVTDSYQAKCDRIITFAGLQPETLGGNVDMEPIEEAVAARIEQAEAKIERAREIIGPVEALDPDQGGCEGAWDEQLLAILKALGEDA